MNKLVFINPGHDLELDSGAVNEDLGLRECEINAQIGELVSEYLKERHIPSIVVQSDNLCGEDSYSYRYSVCAQANLNRADLFVSIHCNAFSNCNANGTETLIYDYGGKSEYAARFIQENLVEYLETTDRGVKVRNDLIVLKNTNMPAVLVEPAFISNYDEAIMLRDRQEEIAEAIAEGIISYLEFAEERLEGV